MKGHLLDTNVLIALLWPSHAQHERAVKWFTRHRAKGWATCPLTETGFVRIVS
ncbi:MAG TPA: VapC toxin family PIN domain ribonuclease, partial [Verrucomicrobiales bacterium]|nr:VapC toxin family PIN domain ribonuclease [Verrucomicrobiales bacterium]